jgi:hypothetical protein
MQNILEDILRIPVDFIVQFISLVNICPSEIVFRSVSFCLDIHQLIDCVCMTNLVTYCMIYGTGPLLTFLVKAVSIGLNR